MGFGQRHRGDSYGCLLVCLGFRSNDTNAEAAFPSVWMSLVMAVIGVHAQFSIIFFFE